MKRAAFVASPALLIAVLLIPAGPAHASHQNAHERPVGPAKARFGPGFPALKDSEWGFPLGGFGGIRPGASRRHVPVIFVHGNNVDHADWYLVRDDFRQAGWTTQEMWALSYNGLGNDNGNTAQRDNPEGKAERREMGGDGIARVANNDISAVPDLYRFIMAVRTYTGSAKFSIVTHSLGVTVARKTLKVHPELRKDLVGFVGIAGGNHGTSLCPPGTEGRVYACDEVAANTPWLADLNGPDGSDETYAPAKWLTIYDGSGVMDGAFAGPYADSPMLKGADNRKFPFTAHNMLRVSTDMVTLYREFLETAEKPYLNKPEPKPVSPPPSPATTVRGNKQTLAETGIATGTGPRTAGAALLAAALTVTALIRRRTS